MARKNPWLKAREDAGLTQLEATIETRSHLPRRYWFDPTKLSRFENGGSALIDPLALGVLAKLYGKNLREVDASAADELDQIEATVRALSRRTRRKYAPRDSNPEPADAMSQVANASRTHHPTSAAIRRSASRAA